MLTSASLTVIVWPWKRRARLVFSAQPSTIISSPAKRQHRPETLEGQHSRNRKRHEAQAPEKQCRLPNAQRAIRANLDSQQPCAGITQSDHRGVSGMGRTTMVAQENFYSRQKLTRSCRDRDERAVRPLRGVPEAARPGAAKGRSRAAVRPNWRVRVSKFSFWRGIVGSRRFAIQPANGARCDSIASLVRSAWLMQPRRMPTTRMTGRVQGFDEGL